MGTLWFMGGLIEWDVGLGIGVGWSGTQGTGWALGGCIDVRWEGSLAGCSIGRDLVRLPTGGPGSAEGLRKLGEGP